MSIVGPRPLTPGELDSQNGNHEIYESVKPGITSWWSSHGRSNTSYDQRLELEYYYVKNQSFILDLKCLLATVKAVLIREGAKKRVNSLQSIEIICPLYNAANYIESFNYSLQIQKNVNIQKIHYILTESNDNTESILIHNNLFYTKISKKEFSHSLVRENAAMASDADVVVFVTQDVEIVNDDWLYKLTSCLNDEIVASFSRQVTKFDNIEKYTREKNYPEVSRIVSARDIEELGLNTFFFSDASSAIKTAVFKKLNGYDGKNLPTNEDMYFAHKLITNGYSIKYCADSVVYHSHDFSFKELYERYWLTGKFFKENSYLNEYGTNSSGAELAIYILKRVLEEKRFGLLLRFPFDMAARFLGMRAGMK